jgi:hypothetical protein
LAPCEIVPVIDDEEELEKVNLSGYLFFLFSFLHIWQGYLNGSQPQAQGTTTPTTSCLLFAEHI